MKGKAVALSLVLASSVFAQNVDAEITKLKEEIEVLKEEIRKLKLSSADVPIDPKEISPGGYGLGPAASKALLNPKGISIGGYGEIWFTNRPNKQPNSEIDLYRFIIYLGYAFNEKLKFNSEIEIEHAKVEGGEEGGELAIEFAFLDYRFKREFGVRGGMVLVPVGITNEFHEPPTYFSVRQPYVEKTLFPFTWRENGVGVYGDTDLVEYRAYIINGLKAEEGKYKARTPLDKLAQDGSQASADGLAFTGRVDFKLPKNLRVGLATFISEVQNEKGEIIGRVNLFSPHLWWQYGGWDVRFVGAYTTTSNADRISEELSPATCQVDPTTCNVFPKRMNGFYLQVAYNVFRFFDTDHELYLFGKYEDINLYDEVPSGYPKPKGYDFRIYNVGLSYFPHPLVALKADYVRKDVSDLPDSDEDIYSMAITWMF